VLIEQTIDFVATIFTAGRGFTDTVTILIAVQPAFSDDTVYVAVLLVVTTIEDVTVLVLGLFQV
jgi:hypothetical protein